MTEKIKIYRFIIIISFFCVFDGFAQKQNIKFINSELMQPPYLHKGDTVMILATAGILKDSTLIENGIAVLKDWGLNFKLGKNLFKQNHHFAGSDKERIADLQEAVDNADIKAIWCARGGYGTVRIIDRIDFSKFIENPKWFIGFSDVTVLHSEIHKLGRESIHALMPSTIKPDDDEQKKAIKSLKNALFGNNLIYRIDSSKFNKEGEAKGQLVGGNLSILYSLLGSKSSISTGGKILFIEDLGEYVYHIDRMLMNLKRNGYFDNCAGLIVGAINDIRENDVDFGKTIEEVILDAVKEYHFPVCFDFPAGHITDNRALIIGRVVILKVKEKKVIIKFSK
jgi:muramoyltetrapeptide carboxypeptidase